MKAQKLTMLTSGAAVFGASVWGIAADISSNDPLIAFTAALCIPAAIIGLTAVVTAICLLLPKKEISNND